MLKQKPSARIKRRYLLVKGKRESIEKAILDYIGILGWANASPIFVKKKGDKSIFGINRKEIDKVRGALAISADELEVLKVSGTLKGLEKS